MKAELELIEKVLDQNGVEHHLLFKDQPAYGVVFSVNKSHADRIRATINRCEDFVDEGLQYCLIARCDFRRSGSMEIYFQNDEDDYEVCFPSLKHWEEFNLVVRHVFSIVKTKFSQTK